MFPLGTLFMAQLVNLVLRRMEFVKCELLVYGKKNVAADECARANIPLSKLTKERAINRQATVVPIVRVCRMPTNRRRLLYGTRGCENGDSIGKRIVGTPAVLEEVGHAKTRF